MAAVKATLCLIVTIGLAYAENIPLDSPHRAFLAQPLEAAKGTRALVVDTNLPAADANLIGNDIQQIYNSVSGALNRVIAIQNKLNQRFPTLHNIVIINYQAAAYYQRYYVIVAVNGDNVLCFGL